MSGRIKKIIGSVLSAVMIISALPMIAMAAQTADITIEYRKEEGDLVRTVELTEEYNDGEIYTVPDSLKAGFAEKNDDGLYDYFEVNESKSELQKPFASEMTLKLEVNQTDQFDYYEDFEGTTNTSNWKPGANSSAPTIQTDKTTYLKHSSGKSSTGAYMTFDEVNTENKVVKITADIKFTKVESSGAGLGQFAISNKNPSFSNNNIDYGIENSAGHILTLMYRSGTTLEFNKKNANIDFIDQWIHIEADADFGQETVTVKLTNEEGASWEGTDAFYSSAVEGNFGSIYLRSPGVNGTLSVDNVTAKITGEAVEAEPNIKSVINNKSVYAFGDSIVYGHTAPAQSFMRLIANDYAIKLNMMAKNGATIMESSNHILTQIKNAPSAKPDIVVFEGYTNDAYGSKEADPEFNPNGTQRDVTECYGEITPEGTTTFFDTNTFCGSFENTIKTMKDKWGDDAKYVFVTIHKSGARNFEIQKRLHDLTVAMCEKWDIAVVDMFEDSTLDTRDSAQMNKYMIGAKGSHPNVVACKEFYIPAVVEVLEGLYDGNDDPKDDDDKKDDEDPKDDDRIKSDADAAVSGYVSLTAKTGSIELVSENKTPVIHIDDSDYEGVIRAAKDLVNDIKTVTDKKPTVNNDDITVEAEPDSAGISISEDGMTARLKEPLSSPADCYVAVYESDGALKAVKKSTNTIGSGVISGFRFDEVLTKPKGGKIKAFVWKDMEPVTDVLGMVADNDADLDGVDVVIGTLGESKTVDALAASGKIDVSEIEGKWESFTIQNVDNTIVIAGSDKRGTIYGIYDLSEKIGVSPWYFWADTAIGHADELYINLPDGGYTEGEPSVKYRGIFLNDEYNLTQWSTSMGQGNMNNETYEKIFELLLRLKANYLWPAMHKYSTAFNATEGNAELADKYGIVMGSSHCEPILRNNLGELYAYQEEWIKAHPDKKLYINTKDESGHNVSWMWTDKDGSGNAVDNKEFLTDYWRERLKANGGYENTYTLGMRGVHDGSFQTNVTTSWTSEVQDIINAQTAILEEEAENLGVDISDIPQVFIPYKEMLTYYNQGLQIPDYVTLMWTDDNFGYIRQLPTEKEAERSGGAGIYYHLSYHGRPTSYLWLGTTQPGLIREEMTKAYDMDAREIWVANVGDLKPAETEAEYFLDLARDVETMRNRDIADWLKENAKRDFGFDDETAAEYADIKLGYYEIANSRRPEHMDGGLFSLTDFGDEGQTLLDRYQAIEDHAETIYDELPDEKKPSLYELLLYPIKGAHDMAEKYVYADKAKYYADNGYGTAANKYAALSNAANTRIDTDTKVYTDMLNGKWDKMMNPRQTGVNGSFGGTITGALNPPTVATVPYTTMTIVPEGGNSSLGFNGLNARTKFVDIINSGSGSFNWRATADEDWIILNKTSGTVADDDRIYVGIDWSKNFTINQGSITFERVIGDTVIDKYNVPVTAYMPSAEAADGATYYEADGYVSIEAEHYTRSVANGAYEWKVEKDFGRSGDSVKIYPNRAATVSNPGKENSAYLEYNVYFENSGTFPIDVYRMPTVNELSGATLRCRIGVDDAAPVQFGGNTKTSDGSNKADSWSKGVLQNTEILSGTITVSEPGMHTIRLYNESPGVVIDKFVITTGEKKASYYGAPESYNTEYNRISSKLPDASTPADKQTGSVTALFSPSAIITSADSDSAEIVKIGDVNKAVFIAASYKDGKMLEMTSVDVDFSGTDSNAVKTVEYDEVIIPEAADTVQYMLVSSIDADSESSFEALSPALEIAVPSLSLLASYDNGYVYPATKMNDYYGRESVCVITNTDGEIKYIRQNTVKEDTYSKIPFGGEGKHNLKIKIAGVDGIISESFNTVINIRPNTDAASFKLHSWDFASEEQIGSSGEKNVPVLGSNAKYSSEYQCIKMTSADSDKNNNMTIDFDEPITMQQGEKLTIVSKIAYGDLSSKYMTYEITDSKGTSLVRSNICRYNNSTQSLTIGGIEQLIDGAYPPGLDKVAKGGSPAGKFATYTTEIDTASGMITVTVTAGTTVTEYTGKIPDGTSYNLSKLYYTSNYQYQERSCYVDDISITKSKAAAYKMTFKPVDSESEEEIASAEITVTDGVTGAVITPEADGTYILCDGIYNYTITAAGYETLSDVFELSPATEAEEAAGAECYTVPFYMIAE
ncbi:MAG: glycosyl hydrolase 115 family protein [Oscillospiraceae bacterium]|nr:glycosyl hydrolase 115 family protein [Oscillospiraceae bacterium]